MLSVGGGHGGRPRDSMLKMKVESELCEDTSQGIAGGGKEEGAEGAENMISKRP